MRFAVVFPGQGSQFAGMADPWISHPAGKSVIEEASEALGRDLGSGCHDENLLATTEFVQPALLACGLAAFAVLESEGVGGWVGAAGHSLGELAAFVAAGACSLGDIVGVVAVRGRAMQRAADERAGAMIALLGDGASHAAAICNEASGGEVLVVANENSPGQVVISGDEGAVERAVQACRARGVRTIRLNVAGAFHSPLMQPAVAALGEAIDGIEFRTPTMPVASNVTGALVTDPQELRALSKRQIVSTVLWNDCMGALSASGADAFVEAGPGDVLTKLAKRIVPGARAVSVASPGAAAALVHG